MRKTIFPVLIYCVSQLTTAEEPQKITDGDHKCLLERWNDGDNIKVYNYLGKVPKCRNIIIRQTGTIISDSF